MTILPSDLVEKAALEGAQQGARTVSELLFESICDRLQIGYKPIPTEKGAKTPDFELTIGGQKIIAEVKELTDDTKPGEGRSETVGARIRTKIKKCARQLRTRTAGRHPGMLVLYADGQQGYFYAHLAAAMYGTHTIDLAVPQDRSVKPYVVGERFGAGRQMTPDHNTSISAVCTIFRDSAQNWNFDFLVYHNAHAAIPIEPGLLAQHGIRQLHMDFDSMQWRE